MTPLFLDKLSALCRRVKRHLLLHAAGWVAVWSVCAIAAAGTLDFIFRYGDPGIRFVSSLAVLAVIAWAVWRYLLPVLAARVTPLRIARQLDRLHPEWSDGLSSAVEFAAQRGDDPRNGSAVLRRAALIEMDERLAEFDFNAVLVPRAMRRMQVTLAGVLAVALVAFALFPVPVSRGVMRVVVPWGDIRWPQQTHLVVNSPERVARGNPFRVEVTERDGQLPAMVSVEYRWRGEGGEWMRRERWMRRVGDRMIDQWESVTRSFQFRVAGGDDHSQPWIDVQVVNPPELEQWTAEITPPEYTGFPVEQSDGPVVAVVGSTMRIEGRARKPLARAAIHFDDGHSVEGAVVGNMRREFAIPKPGTEPVAIEQSGEYWLRIEATDGSATLDDQRWPIRAIEDTPPAIWFEQAQLPRMVTLQGSLEIAARFKDDLAVRRAALLVEDANGGGEPERAVLYEGPWPAPEPDYRMSQVDRWGDEHAVRYEWAAADSGVLPGDEIRVRLVAEDYRGAQAESPGVSVGIVTAEEFLQHLGARRNTITQRLAELLRTQQEAQRSLSVWCRRIEQEDTVDRPMLDRLRAVDMLQRQVTGGLAQRPGSVPQEIDELLRQMEANQLAKSDEYALLRRVVEVLVSLNRTHLLPLEERLTAAVKTVEITLDQTPGDVRLPSSLTEDGRVVLEHQGAAIETLQELLSRLGHWQRRERFQRDLARLRADQRRLADQVVTLARDLLAAERSSLSREQSAALDSSASRQIELALRCDDIIDGMRGAVVEGESAEGRLLQDVLNVADETTPAAVMREAADQIGDNRLSSGHRLQKDVLAALDAMLDILSRREQSAARQEREHKLAEKLEDLAGQQRELAAVARRARDASEADERSRLLEEFRRRQASLAENAEQLQEAATNAGLTEVARGVETAIEAMRRASEAAQSELAGEATTGAESAAKQLEATLGQLQQRIADQESREMEQTLRRWMQDAAALAGQQRELLEKTRRIDQQRESNEASDDLAALAGSQRALASATRRFHEEFTEQPVLQAMLEEAHAHMGEAAAGLEAGTTGRPVQREQQQALDRLLQTVDALQMDTDGEPAETEQPDDAADQAPPASAEEQMQTALALAQLKLLRQLQMEVHADTAALERRAVAQGNREGLQGEFERLAARQQRIYRWLQQLATQSAAAAEEAESDGAADDQTGETPASSSDPEPALPAQPDDTLDDILAP